MVWKQVLDVDVILGNVQSLDQVVWEFMIGGGGEEYAGWWEITPGYHGEDILCQLSVRREVGSNGLCPFNDAGVFCETEELRG